MASTHITEADISTETINVGDIFALSTYVKGSSLRAIAPICSSYRDQNISEYKPTYCMTNRNRHSLILPPILEIHGNKLVVVDGTHRLFYLYAEQQYMGAFCLILRNVPDLPSKPIPFKDVKAWPRNLPRDQVFINYDRELYRNFTPLDDRLASGVFSQGHWRSR